MSELTNDDIDERRAVFHPYWGKPRHAPPERPAPREPGKRRRPWYAVDTRRLTPSERGYDARWRELSERYRREHPLCVPCRLVNVVRPSRCVDHIVPRHSCAELFWERENWAAMCFSCHSRKTAKEPRESWRPRRDRIVACGLPGTGKTTWARWSGLPYWDADERPELLTIDAIRAARDEWIDGQRGACVVIVASITTASLIAARLRGVTKHFTTAARDRLNRGLATYVE